MSEVYKLQVRRPFSLNAPACVAFLCSRPIQNGLIFFSAKKDARNGLLKLKFDPSSSTTRVSYLPLDVAHLVMTYGYFDAQNNI
jgi:hypothetical protein